MSNDIKKQENEDNFLKNFDFEIIYSDDIKRIKELDNDNKDDLSTNISQGTNEIKYNNFNNILEIKIDDNKNQKFEKSNFSYKSFISLDTKNYLRKNNPKTSYELYNKMKLIYDNDKISKKLKELTKTIKCGLLNILFPEINQDFFSICKNISKTLKKDGFLSKSIVENNLNFFLLRQNYFVGDTILIDKNFINNCGPILAYSYNRLKKLKIKEQNSFLYNIIRVINEKVNVKMEYDKYFSGKIINSDKLEHIKYFKKIRKKYIILPEIIYLINLFIATKKIIIDINISIKEYNITLLYYFIICLLNFPFIIKNIECIKFNFLNEELLNYMYQMNESKLINTKEFLNFKKNKINEIMKKKGNSIKNVEECFLNGQKIMYINKEINNNKFMIGRKSSPILKFKEIEERKEYLYNSSKNLNIIINKDENSNKLISIFNKENSNFILIYKKKFIRIILEMIMILFVSLDNFSNLENLELIIADAYYFEFFSYFKDKLKIKVENFHILNLIYNKLVKLKTLYLEINSFDLITFNQILNIIYNCKATSLKLSFFTIDYIYSSPFLYRLYLQNNKRKLIKNDNKVKNDLNDEFYRNIYPKFVDDLNSLFELLKYKNLLSLIMNFQIPSYILNDEKYIIIFIKFIINIFMLYFDDNESQLRELTLSSPSLTINGTKYIFIDEFLQNNNTKNNHLFTLNIHLKFFKIRNLYKFIPEKLKKLSIGDLDFFSFKNFIEAITEYKLVKNSSLEQLSIKLNNIIQKFDKEIKLIIAKLFNIEIQNLVIHLYTNIQININDYKEIINILQYNWNYNYFLSFNNKSKQIIKENYWMTKKLVSLIPNKSEGNYSNYLKEKTEKNLVSFSYINQCLKKAIFKANNAIDIDFYTQKKIISSIFSFLYITKSTKISFSENSI